MTLLNLRVPPNPWNVSKVRDQLIRFGTDLRMSPEALEDFVTAIGEAFANAIEHARTVEPVDINIRSQGEHIVAMVRDRGCGIDPRRVLDRLPPATTERGRGIPLMRRCSSSIEISEPIGGGTLIVLFWETARLQIDRPLRGGGSQITTLSQSLQ
ncbi:MAG: ATP-binding protein [Candidatus Eremiobacteraeota bacterium]|nr:ATP-binding protein [Candidatus Eremiobacteraeota bacterium]